MKRFAFFSCPCPAVGRLFQRPGAGKHRAWYLCAIAKPSTTSQRTQLAIWLLAPSPEEYYASAESVESLMFQPLLA